MGAQLDCRKEGCYGMLLIEIVYTGDRPRMTLDMNENCTAMHPSRAGESASSWKNGKVIYVMPCFLRRLWLP